MDRPATIADALVSLLNQQSFSLPFTAKRRFAPQYRLEDLRDLAVSVCPRLQEIETASRGDDHDDISIDVWIAKQIRGKDETEQADPVAVLAQEITDFLRRRQVPGIEGLSWLSTKRLYVVPEHLQQRNVFMCAVTQTYRLVVET